MPMVDGDGLLRISKCLLLVLLLQHFVWMDGDSVAELCWQTRLRMDVGGQRQSQRQSRRPRQVRDRVRDRVKAEMEAQAEAGTDTLKITGHQ